MLIYVEVINFQYYFQLFNIQFIYITFDGHLDCLMYIFVQNCRHLSIFLFMYMYKRLFLSCWGLNQGQASTVPLSYITSPIRVFKVYLGQEMLNLQYVHICPLRKCHTMPQNDLKYVLISGRTHLSKLYQTLLAFPCPLVFCIFLVSVCQWHKIICSLLQLLSFAYKSSSFSSNIFCFSHINL